MKITALVTNFLTILFFWTSTSIAATYAVNLYVDVPNELGNPSKTRRPASLIEAQIKLNYGVSKTNGAIAVPAHVFNKDGTINVTFPFGKLIWMNNVPHVAIGVISDEEILGGIATFISEVGEAQALKNPDNALIAACRSIIPYEYIIRDLELLPKPQSSTEYTSRLCFLITRIRDFHVCFVTNQRK